MFEGGLLEGKAGDFQNILHRGSIRALRFVSEARVVLILGTFLPRRYTIWRVGGGWGGTDGFLCLILTPRA